VTSVRLGSRALRQVRDLGEDALLLARVARDLPGFLRRPIDLPTARAIVRRRLERREANFLALAEATIYRRPSSPYYRLLRLVGCESGDLATLLAREGLDGALLQLAEAGVWVAYDEYKGRTDLVRGSQRLRFAESDFDNPLLRPHFAVRSGGSRGPASTIKRSLGFVADQAATMAVVLRAHGLDQAEHAIWLTAGVTHLLRYLKLGRPTPAWFYPVAAMPLQVRLGSQLLAGLGRLAGQPVPRPTFADLREPDRLARWLADFARAGRPVCLSTFPSSAVRISLAAQEQGLDLSGVWFDLGGEPYTAAKQQTVEASGARAILCYAFMEGGIVGYSCAAPLASDDLHFFSDAYALVQRPRLIPASETTVDGFLFSTLLPSAAKILFNVEIGDYGRITQRSCGCELELAGLTTHVSHVRSFEKLTSEGMAFVQSDLLPILERFLPERFGGSSTDYQLVEQEGARGVTSLLLLVNPSLGPLDEAEIRRTFLSSLAQDGLDGLSAAMWERAGTITVRRERPIPTPAGKLQPFHLLRGSEAIRST
jgi:hypothetical protein